MDFQYRRVPRWILLVGVIGTPVGGLLGRGPAALGFGLGTLGSWWNYASLLRVVNALAEAAASGGKPRMTGLLLNLFLRLMVVCAGSIAILKYSKTSLIALLIGLFASCIAIGLEISQELLCKSTKSG